VRRNLDFLQYYQFLSKVIEIGLDGRLEANSFNSFRETAQIMRIERGLYQELLNYSGVLGRVGQIYQKGFDLIRGDESIIHFRGETWLHSPFGAVLDQPIPKWVEDVSLREGDIFERKVDCYNEGRETGVLSN